MTADALDQKFGTAPLGDAFAEGKSRLASVLTFFAYVGVFVGYTTIFLVSLLTVGFLEIRQANMSDFNALIAVLEQCDDMPTITSIKTPTRFAKTSMHTGHGSLRLSVSMFPVRRRRHQTEAPANPPA